MRARDGNVEGGTREGASRTNAVLVGDDLPELGTDLVAALATLDCDDLTHVCSRCLGATDERLPKAKTHSWSDLHPP